MNDDVNNFTIRIDQLVRAMPDIAAFKTPDGVYLACNREFEVFAGRPAQEIVGRNDLEIFSDEMAQDCLSSDQIVCDLDKVCRFTQKISYTDRTDGICEVVKQPIRDETGTMIGILLSTRDITHERQTEYELKSTIENYHHLLGTIDDMIIVATEQGEIRYINQAVSRKLGYTLEDLASTHVLDLNPADKRTEALQIFADMFAGLRDACPLPLVRKDHTLMPAETRVWFGKWDDERCMFGISKDLSKEQEALQLFNKLFDFNPALMAISSVKDHTFVDVNQTFLDTLGYDRDQLIGRTANEIGLFVDPERQKEMARIVLNNGHIRNQEAQIYKADKSIMTGLFSGELIESQGHRYYLTVMTDITQAKANEQQLILAKEQAEAGNRAKSRFLANMSHEIRTPMNGMLGFLQLLEFQVTDPEQKRYLEKIRDSAHTLREVIDEILDMSKIEAGQLSLECIVLDLADTIQAATSLYQLKSLEKGVDFHCWIDPELPPFMMGDPTRIRQVLSNLVSNAVKFTERGSIDIRLLLDRRGDGSEHMRVEVEDSRIAISPEDQRMLFTPFFQADSTTTRKYGGTGLGLSICQDLVQLIGGTIGVHSESGQGSTFWFTVPLLRADNPDPANQQLEASQLADFTHLRLLLVEDNLLNREVAIAMLEMAGIQVDAVTNGAEAVETVRSHVYDLVLMDIQMPVMSGYKATIEIIRQSPDQHPPIVAMTAGAMPEEREEAARAGMIDYIAKPFEMNELLQTIARVCSRNTEDH